MIISCTSNQTIKHIDYKMEKKTEKKTKKNKLTEVQSIHEQREAMSNPEVIVKKGVWLEIVNFTLDTEQVEVLRRFEVEKVIKSQEGDIKKYKVICKELNIKELEEQKRKTARLVLDKHHERLKESFVKCLLDGISIRSIRNLKAVSS